MAGRGGGGGGFISLRATSKGRNAATTTVFSVTSKEFIVLRQIIDPSREKWDDLCFYANKKNSLSLVIQFLMQGEQI